MSFRVSPQKQAVAKNGGSELKEPVSANDVSVGKMVEEAASEGAGLKRSIGLVGTTSILIGTIIGSGIFASPSVVAAQVQSPGATLIVWAGCGVIAMLAALCWMELGCMFPNEGGGEYTYLGHAFGPIAAFLYAYVNVLVTRPASLCIISLTCGNYIIQAFGLEANQGGFQYNKLIAASLLG